jgi:hypothetical protein
MLSLPTELVLEVASHVELPDLSNLKMTSKGFLAMLKQKWLDELHHGRVIYSTYESMKRFLCMLQAVDGLLQRVTEIELVAEGLKLHEYGSEWAWEDVGQWEQVEIKQEDVNVINKINADHAVGVENSNNFLHVGGYRNMLGQIIAACPNLRKVNIRKLKVSCIPCIGFGCLLTFTPQIDEHIPDWTDTSKFKELSFFRPGLALKPIFYGDWQYDILHHRVTHYKDEFGDDIIEPNAGPQAKFNDDVDAAILASGKILSKNVIR